MRKFPTYEDGLIALLGVTGALLILDRGAIASLSPFIVKELHLSNGQLGLAASAVSLTWAIAGFAVGRLSDTAGRRKPFLIAAVALFSLCSAASGLASGFVGLLVARLVMGLGEGPTATLTNTLMVEASSPGRRGLNMGLSGLLTVVPGAILAPPILVALSTHFGWRTAFFIAGAPGLLAAVAIHAYVRDTGVQAQRSMTPKGPTEKPAPLLDILRVRNIWLCALIGTLMVGFAGVTGTFLPLFLVQVRHLSVADMAIVMGLGGGGGMLAVPVVFALSDRFGRKPLMVALAGAGATLPISLAYWNGGVIGLALLCLVGFAGASAAALTLGMVPGESVQARDRGTAMGIVMGASEILGGFSAPAVAGFIADRSSLLFALLAAGGGSFVAMFLALSVRETAPRHVQRLAGLGQPSLAPSE